MEAIKHFKFSVNQDIIYLGDDNDNIRKLDLSLNLLEASHRPLHSLGEFKWLADDEYLFSRD